MPDIDITYKSTSIATMNDSGTKTLKTSGKYCESDIVVTYVKTVNTVVISSSTWYLDGNNNLVMP